VAMRVGVKSEGLEKAGDAIRTRDRSVGNALLYH
jgi:hypothetical protein